MKSIGMGLGIVQRIFYRIGTQNRYTTETYTWPEPREQASERRDEMREEGRR